MHAVDPTAVRFILANCTDDSRLAEFENWYGEYGQGLTRVGFFKNMVRYESSAMNPRFAVVYDIDSPYPGLAWPVTRSHPKKLELGPSSPLLDVRLRSTYQRVVPARPLVLGQRANYATFVLSDVDDPASIPALDAYFEKALYSTQAVNASRYALVEGQPDLVENEPNPPHYLEIYESDKPLDPAVLRLDNRPKSLTTRFVGTYAYSYSTPEP
jgi:hypothetical protein